MEDHQIISLFLSRSDDAIVELKGKYGGLCRSVIRNILHDPSEAEECLNDTLLGVWNAIPPAQPQTLSAFVCRIARNLALKRVEYWSAAKRSRALTLSLDELDEYAVDPVSIERQLDDKALGQCINQFLATLRETERKVFVLRYWYNCSVKEIAVRQHFSLSKTESMLHRTRQKLKQYLHEKGYYHDKS